MLNAGPAIFEKPVSETLDDERPRPDSEDQATFQHHLARYEFAMKWIQPHQQVLETACGTGYGSYLLACRANSVLATDYSKTAIAYARAHFVRENLRFEVMDCNRWTAPVNSFDCVISFEVLEHLPRQVAYLRTCYNSLRPGGILLLSTPNRATAEIHMRSIGQQNEFHIGEVDLPELRALLTTVFGKTEIYGQRRRGSRIYSALRALDIWNLRLRLVSNVNRERLQCAMGVPEGPQAKASDWIFSKSQLHQANNFFAVCCKTGKEKP